MRPIAITCGALALAGLLAAAGAPWCLGVPLFFIETALLWEVCRA